MFDMSFGEMILLAAIALIAIGPKQLPDVARTVGKLLGELKKAVGDVTSTVANARDETDRALRGVTDQLSNVTHDINKDLQRHIDSTMNAEDLPVHAGDPPFPEEPKVPEEPAVPEVKATAPPEQLPLTAESSGPKRDDKKPAGGST